MDMRHSHGSTVTCKKRTRQESAECDFAREATGHVVLNDNGELDRAYTLSVAAYETALLHLMCTRVNLANV